MTNQSESSSANTSGAGQPELITILKTGADIRATREGLISPKVDTSPLRSVLEQHGAIAQPLFGLSEERLRTQLEELGAPVISAASGEPAQATQAGRQRGALAVPDLAQYYRVTAPAERLEQLAADLRAQGLVEAAYVKPAGRAPSQPESGAPARGSNSTETNAAPSAVAQAGPAQSGILRLNTMTPDAADAPPSTPTYLDRQGYLNPAPAGVDAALAWTVPGGGGAGVRVIDCEWGWRFTHEDLLTNQGGVVAGTASTDTNHGTAVVGVISADRNAFGVTGIVPDAVISASSFTDQSSAVAIKAAADKLSAGDIILLEIHRPGPNTPNPEQGQLGFIAIEWWPDDFAAIRYAVVKGIVVIEAAGNGFQNLDDAVYNTAPAGFPAGWTNPFNPANPSSGAVVVGAGAPPPGTHGRDHGPDRSRLDFSNYGARVDVQGWGREVTTTGYGDLQGGGNADLWYTDTFSGTSSASPVVTGALASVQGVLKARGRRLLNSPEARRLVRASGSPQQDDPNRPAGQRIGTRPNLRSLIPRAAQFTCRSGDFDGDGRAEVLVSSPWGVGLLQQSGTSMTAPMMQPNGTRFGGWLLNTADNLLGPVADFDGDGRVGAIVTSPWGLGIWEQAGTTMAAPMMAPNGTRFGGWLLNTADNNIGPAADFDGDRCAEVFVTSPWGVGILKQAGTTMTAPMMAPNGTRFGGWLLNTADNSFGPVGDFDGDGRVEILVTSPWGIGLLRQNGPTFDVVTMAPNGTRFGGWLLNTADNTFGPVGDFDGDGRAEVMISSPWGVGILKLSGSTFTASMMAPNGTRFGGWLLNTADNTFGPARDLDGDGCAEIVVTSPWGVGILKQSGGMLTAPMMAPNGTRFGGWLLNTADNQLGSSADYDADGHAEILVTSPWGVGILKQNAATLDAPMMASNGTRFGGWLLNTDDNDFGHGI